MHVLTIGGITPDIEVLSIQRNATIFDGANSGRLKNGNVVRDVIGTYYDYAYTAKPKSNNLTAYDEFYELITAPVDSYNVEVPFGQGILAYSAYINDVSDEIQIITTNKYWDGLAFTINAKEPQRYLGEIWTPTIPQSQNNVFTIDGYKFDVIVSELKRTSTVLELNNQKTMSGRANREIIGTIYNYEMSIEQLVGSAKDYDTLYYLLTAPVESHHLSIPYGQTMYEFDVYISEVKDKLTLIKENINVWNDLKVKFTAMQPKRRAL